MEHGTLDLRVVSSRPTLGIEIIKKKKNLKKIALFLKQEVYYSLKMYKWYVSELQLYLSERYEELFVYEKLNNLCLFIDETLLINVVCGILSGVVSSTIANPTDVLKVSSEIHIL